MTRLRRLLAGTVLGTVLVAGAGIAHLDAAQAESNGGVKIMPLGDSITDGMTVAGGYRINLWQKLVADGYKVDFVGSLSNGPASLGDHDHEGHSGWRIDQIDTNIVGWLQKYTPRTILLHIGTNDMYQNPNGAPQRLGTLLDKITNTAPDADVFVATIIPMPSSDSAVRTYNAAVPGVVQTRIAAGKHLHLVDMFPALTSTDLADGVHPNANGYGKMATVWYNALKAVPGSLGGTTSPSPSPTRTSPSPSPTRTSPSPSPTTTSPSPTPTGSKGCTATYKITNQWQGGFQADVTVTSGTSAISGWTVSWTFDGSQAVTSSWNVTLSSSGSAVTARNVGFNGGLGAGASTSFGFTGTWNGSNPVPAVTCVAS